MKIILLQDEKKLGKKGDLIEASDGYARNYILPRKIGVEATPQNLNDLKLKKANISAALNGNTMTLESDTFAYNVFIDCDEIPNSNYFSLAKGEKKVITFEHAPNKYKITCANNIEFKKSGFKKKLFRFFYRLKPLNIGNYFYYTYN